MRRLVLGLCSSLGLLVGLFLCGGLVAPAQASGLNIGVVISGEIQPGVYGRVELGNRPPPVLVYERPMLILAEPRRHPLEPIYLHVPPGHAKNWRKYCGRYNACGRPVYFVKSAEYEPGYRREEGRREDYRRDEDRRDDGDRDDRGRDEDRGHGNSGKHKDR